MPDQHHHIPAKHAEKLPLAAQRGGHAKDRKVRAGFWESGRSGVRVVGERDKEGEGGRVDVWGARLWMLITVLRIVVLQCGSVAL